MLRRDIRQTLTNVVPDPVVAPEPQPAHGGPAWMPIALVGAGVFAVLLLVIGAAFGQWRTGPLQDEVRDLRGRVIALGTPAPACRSAGSLLALINDQERDARWTQAAANAESALRASDLCPGDRNALAAKAVSAGVNALFAEPASTDQRAQQTAVDRYASLRRLADGYSVPFPLSDRQIAERARQGSWFLLALRAWEDALKKGEVSDGDLPQVRFYVANLYDLGYWWTQPGATTRDEGLRYLVAAYRLDVQYRLGSGLAWGRLRELLGPDERRWPEAAPSPLLPTPVPPEATGGLR